VSRGGVTDGMSPADGMGRNEFGSKPWIAVVIDTGSGSHKQTRGDEYEY
jgi:hypothetical protein